MGKSVVIEDFSNRDGYFVRIEPDKLYEVAYFLKHDPDVRLMLFDQILLIPSQYLPWATSHGQGQEILYQLRSLKLPYRVTLVVAITDEQISMPSIKGLFAGALGQEEEIARLYGLSLEEQES